MKMTWEEYLLVKKLQLRKEYEDKKAQLLKEYEDKLALLKKEIQGGF